MSTVERINQRARDHAYDIDVIDWHRGVDHERWFFPEDQMPLSFTAGWRTLLNEEQRRVANQWYACAVAEQFIFLEECFLAPAVTALLRHRVGRSDAALREALEVFLVEERKHGEMFRRLLRASAPQWYEHRDRHFYTPAAAGVSFGAACLQLPTLAVAWPWLGMILEEKTIAYHRAYERAAAAGATLDELHRQVHRYHFLDEARHVQLEAVLVERLWDTASPWRKQLNRPLLFSALAAYTRPRARSVSGNIITALVQRFPTLVLVEQPLREGLWALRTNVAFQRQVYGHDAIPQTFRALAHRPELHGIVAVAPDFSTVARA